MDGRIPFWEIGGNAVLYENYVELTPAEQSKSGWITNTWVITVILNCTIHLLISLIANERERMGS